MALKRLYNNPETKTFEEAVIASSAYSSDKFVEIASEIKQIVDFESTYTTGYKPSPEQYRSILSQADRILIDACPGSGKTTSMIFKIMVDTKVNDYKYGDQLVLTYTNKAAEDMNKKYSKLCSRHKVQPCADMFTIHSFAYKMQSNEIGLDILTDKPKTVEIITDRKAKVVEKEEVELDDKYSGMLDFLGGDEEDDYQSEYEVEYKTVTEVSIYLEVLEELGMSRIYFNNCNQLPQWINTIVEGNIRTDEELLSIELFSELETVRIKDLWRIEKAAREKRLSYGLINFTDMLVLFYNRLKEANTLEDLGTISQALDIKVLYVDEVQDISQLQWDIFMQILRLNPNCRMLCVGDTDQSIFSFRGSSPKFITHFEDFLDKEECNNNKTLDTISYTINRRSSKKIIGMSTHFISNNIDRLEKEMVPLDVENGDIQFKTCNTRSEEWIDDIVMQIKEIERNYGKEALGDVAILYREHKQGMKVIRRLIRESIIVKFPGEIGINMSETEDLIGIINLLNNPTNYHYVEKYLYKCLRSINRDRGGKIALMVREQNKPFTAYINQSGPIAKEVNKLREAYVYMNSNQFEKAVPILVSQYKESYLKYIPSRLWKLDEAEDVLLDYRGMNYSDFRTQIETDKLIMSNLSKNSIGVTPLTFHSSKGLEFDTVFILPISNKVSPKMEIANKMSPNNKQKYIEEERRLLYVAMTRSKRNLTIMFGEPNAIFPSELREAKLASEISKGGGLEWSMR